LRALRSAENVIGRKGADAAGRTIDADARVHFEGVPLDARLKLLVARAERNTFALAQFSDVNWQQRAILADKLIRVRRDVSVKGTSH
jgi:hypothetical protein